MSLEDLDPREFAENDPRGVLNQFSEGVILDEAQRCLARFSYLQTRVDDRQRPGDFILTGSQQFGLLLSITQRLAGRAAFTHNTAKAWISALEASYIVHLLPPHHRNFDKRLVKPPKLYFLDTGLATWLLGIQNIGQLATHVQRGALFETWIINELLKARYNAGEASNLYWRDRSVHEVDLPIDHGACLSPLEIKSGQTINRDCCKGLDFWRKLAGNSAIRAWLIYGRDSKQIRSDITVLPWQDFNPVQIVGPPPTQESLQTVRPN